MNILKISGILLLELIVQSTVFQFFNIGGIYPDLVLITLICFSIILGEKHSYILGFIIGFIIDSFYRNVLGMNSLSLMITALSASAISENMFKESLLTPLSIFPVSVIINHSILYLVAYLLKMNNSLLDYISGFGLTYWLVNILAVIVIYPLTMKFANKYILKSSTRS